ncbi:transcription factor BIM1-like isoform X2 [Impatiens glandulifera]|uniref:transcription factor BIM1-like isoform X2 n=1 Tax=Impatiens glandulifera TaxID=253017 RepID=UPI001FB14F57|nr:transcription factor BIM1-like isoform X2 [Impatiens glandulifera]
MELPRPLGRQEGRKQTHDFLSLYEPVQQDPISPPPPQAGNFLRTQEFLQPLSSRGENNGKEIMNLEKAPTPAGGWIGTNYSISQISLFNKVLQKVEGGVFTMAQAGNINKNDVNSNCSSYPVNGFTLWERSAMAKGKTRKENIAGDIPVTVAAGIIMGEGEWPSQSSSNNSSSNHHHLASTTYSSLSSSQPLSANKNKSFMDMLKSAKISHDEDDDEDEQEFIIKEEPFSNPTMMVDNKRDNQKPSTPRSKHSATEQRRRSKINDRFQSLRELIPKNDQKRDKASFLLEVIEYIQYLQEKVQNFEGPYQRWNQLEPSKSGPWATSHNNNNKPAVEPQLVLSMNGNNTKAQEHDVESDTIKISTAYSHGLLSNLTQALQSSGVDLSQATISVKIDIGKQPNGINIASEPSNAMDSRSEQCSKRMKTGQQ